MHSAFQDYGIVLGRGDVTFIGCSIYANAAICERSTVLAFTMGDLCQHGIHDVSQSPPSHPLYLLPQWRLTVWFLCATPQVNADKTNKEREVFAGLVRVYPSPPRKNFRKLQLSFAGRWRAHWRRRSELYELSHLRERRCLCKRLPIAPSDGHMH